MVATGQTTNVSTEIDNLQLIYQRLQQFQVAQYHLLLQISLILQMQHCTQQIANQ